MTRARSLLRNQVAVIALALVAGCGGKDTGPQTDSKAGDGAKPPTTVCPAQLPAANAACTAEGVSCDYGTNPRCLENAKCTAGKWAVVSPRCQAPSASCPATREAAANQTCQTKLDYCNYTGLICECTNCTKYPHEQCSGPLIWHCEAPSVIEGCPAARPNLGTACTTEGLLCEYGCEPGISRKCTAGIWVAADSAGGCPISTRSAKTDIRYLTDEMRSEIAATAKDLKLATYSYKDPALRGRTHLGFILEDSPTNLASDMEHKQVDLYSYASLALVLAQQQQREISDLRRQLEALRVQLSRVQRR